MHIPRVGLRSYLKTKNNPMSAGSCVSARVQALTALSEHLVSTVNDITRAAQLTSHCSRNLY